MADDEAGHVIGPGQAVIAISQGDGFTPTPRISAALDELSLALAEEREQHEVEGFKFLGGLFGGGGPRVVVQGDGDVKVVIPKGTTCTLSVDVGGSGFMDPGDGSDLGLGAPLF
jgi:hypothetical protein